MHGIAVWVADDSVSIADGVHSIAKADAASIAGRVNGDDRIDDVDIADSIADSTPDRIADSRQNWPPHRRQPTELSSHLFSSGAYADNIGLSAVQEANEPSFEVLHFGQPVHDSCCQ